MHCETKIGNGNPPLIKNEQILRLNIPMYNPEGVNLT
jgi:hypothetical protein